MGWKNIISICPAPNFQSMFQGSQSLECQHTIKSHGGRLFWNHKHDWLILIVLVMTEIGLNIIHPFYRFVGEGMMTDLKYPLKENTVPIWAVPIYAVLLPIFVFFLYYLRRRDVYDLHHAILGWIFSVSYIISRPFLRLGSSRKKLAGLLFSVLITGVLTDAIKDGVGRPRPDFFWRCFPDGKESYDQWGNVVCHGEDSVIKEGHKSFPSGHTSWSFAGLVFLTLYLAGKIKAFDRRGHIAKLCIIFTPILAAALVGVSRVDDYWHHWQDVFAGGLLGSVVAFFCYLQFFPPPYNTDGWHPYAYLNAVEELRSNSRPGNATSAQGLNQQQYGSNGNPFLDSSFEDVEFGRR